MYFLKGFKKKDKNMSNTLTVVSSPTEKKEKQKVEPTCSWVDFPMPRSAAEIRSTKDFLQLQPVPINRDFVVRARKLVKELASCKTFKQNEVDIIKYTGESVYNSKHGTWIKDQEYVLNANTRAHIWRSYGNGQTIGSVSFLEIPNEVVANVYESSSIEDIVKCYDTIDSEESVETSSATLSGVLRAQDMNKLESIKLKTGKFVMALNISAPITSKFGYQAITDGDVYKQVIEMKDLIKQFDILKVTGKGALSTQLSMGVAFLAGKYAGVNDSAYIDALIKLSKINLKKDDEKQKLAGITPKDGIDWIIKGAILNPYSDGTLHKALPYMNGLFNDRAGAMNYLAACWKSYLAGETMTSPPTKKQLKNAYVDLVQATYSEDEE